MWNKVENKYTLHRPPKGKDIVLDKILETIEFLDCELAKLLEEVREKNHGGLKYFMSYTV